MNYSEVESKVREATNDDQWGPHGSVMNEIAKFTFMYEHFPEVMGMLWKRMLMEKKNWRRTYKSLLLLHYLLRNGSEKVVTSTRDHLYDMRQLENYECLDEAGKDQVRHKVKELIDFVQDNERLRSERKRAKQNREKYVGLSSNLVSDGFYSDRYDKDPSYKQKDDFDSFDKNNSDFQPRSRLGEFKDKIGQKLGELRPGKRDYKDYKDRGSGRNDYKDEPEDGEEIAEEKDEEDSFSYRSVKSSTSDTSSDVKEPQPQPSVTAAARKPVKKIDLGAAATLIGVAQTSSSSEPSQNGFRQAPQQPLTNLNAVASQPATPAQPQASALNDLVDLMRPTDPPLLPTNVVGNQGEDLFGGFSSAAPATATASNNGNFADFGAFTSTAQQQPLQEQASNDSDFGDFSAFPAPAAPTSSQSSSTLQDLDLLSEGTSQQNVGIQQGFNMQQQRPFQPTSPQMSSMSQTYTNQRQASNTMSVSQQPQQQQQQAKTSTTSQKSTLWSNTGLDISLDTLSPGSTKDKPIQPTMREMTQQQQGQFMQPTSTMYTQQPQQVQQMPVMASGMSMQGMPVSNMANVNSSMGAMNLGGSTGMMQAPMQMNPQVQGMMGSQAGMMHGGMQMGTMQYNYNQTMGMRMPMQAPMYQNTMQGRFKS
eukprot:gene5176-5829_t